ncbi:MAG: ribonuclease P protein component 4 [Thermoplasmata archaeon]
MPRKYIKKRAEIWIRDLLALARRMEIEDNYDLERRYVSLVLEISKHYKVKIPEKRFICKNCKIILIPGKNSTVRIKKGRVNIKCLRCGNIRRFVI